MSTVQRSVATGAQDVGWNKPPVPWYELHCHSNFSFLDGASHPEELIETAGRLGIEGVALTDHDGFYGVVRFAEAAAGTGVRTLFGAELSLELTRPGSGEPDPAGTHLLVLARDPAGYRTLSQAISGAQLAGAKGWPRYHPEALAAAADGRWLVLTGCRKGAVPAALATGGAAAGRQALDRLVALFGRDNVAVELIDHGQAGDSTRNDALAALAADAGLPTVASNNVHYATPRGVRLAGALAAIRARRGLDELDGWLPAAGGAFLRTGAEMTQRFARYPGIVDRTAGIGRECAFDLDLLRPALPRFTTPDGYDEMGYLRALTLAGAADRYGPPDRHPGAYAQIEHELGVIDGQGFPGYFLIVWDIVEFCRRHGILCQGRGSAANSAVCYSLGITAVDAVAHKLLFERFLSTARTEAPDIDIDIESDRREEVIQYVFERYGRDRAAQVANVISYRPKSAVRDMARALGYAPGQQDAWSRQVDNHGPLTNTDTDIPGPVLELATTVLRFPRHLGIHSGGMVLCDRPVVEVCPVEWARMPGRSVLQWDKDDCAHAGLVKFDLLGLGMLAALRYCFELIEAHHGIRYDLATIPKEDPAVYRMLCAADTVGVFQVESRAQMATLPRLRPEKFYDLVVEVAIIRPGPIQGGSVHPYLRRRSGLEAVTYLHPLLKGPLEKTLGVPLFQEQLMQIAIEVAGFSAADADQLRRALSAKRSVERLAGLRPKLMAGMAERGVGPEVAEQIYGKLLAFADFGFPESHAFSFALLVYASAWLKLHYPAAYCAALLNAQPMGFYSAQSLVADARRHGVLVHGPDINASAATATLEPATLEPATLEPGAAASAQPAVRLGLAAIRHVGDALAERIAAGRPYPDLADLVTRHGLATTVIEALATAGALDCLGLTRREALWAAGAAARLRPDQLPHPPAATPAPTLPMMTAVERAAADLWATGVSPDSFPTEFAREQLDALGVIPAAELRGRGTGQRVLVAGVVTHRQRPTTAGGTTFLNLEDETGFVNVICSRGVWQRYRRIARESPALIIRGRLESADGVVNVIAEQFRLLPLSTRSRSRDFR
ncbi:MAG: error-prone DNA polymerase [Actinobacteria bacterium]|nr:error-prone DNA polymerase [Actinomycetota bacterium]MBI3686685.1 error-prone DNA polymerase [Actinomycetota bacterium]